MSLAGGRVMGTGRLPPSGHLGETTSRPRFLACLGLPPPGVAWRLSLQTWVPDASMGDRVGNASASWPGLRPMPCVEHLVFLSAEALMGCRPGDRWPGTSLSRLFLLCALVLWRVFSRGREGCPALQQERMISLSGGKYDGGQGTQDRVPGEPPPTGTLELLAELELLWDRYSQLEEEVEALKNEAEHLGQQEALVQELKDVFLNFWGLLEACAPGQVVCVPPTPGRSWPE